MVMPIILLVVIPILLGIVYVSPFDLPKETEPEVISEEPDGSILYYILIGIWSLYLLRIIFKIKKGTFKVTQKY
jgi:hypothetical protein